MYTDSCRDVILGASIANVLLHNIVFAILVGHTVRSVIISAPVANHQCKQEGPRINTTGYTNHGAPSH